ncbi:hypothetical protein D3C71_766200 [compost metagenome]
MAWVSSSACSNACRTESAEYSSTPGSPACSAWSMAMPVPTITSMPLARRSAMQSRASSRVTKRRCSMSRPKLCWKLLNTGTSLAWVTSPMRGAMRRARASASIRSKPLAWIGTSGRSRRPRSQAALEPPAITTSQCSRRRRWPITSTASSKPRLICSMRARRSNSGMTSPSRPVRRETLTVQITGRPGSASAWRKGERGRYMARGSGVAMFHDTSVSMFHMFRRGWAVIPVKSIACRLARCLRLPPCPSTWIAA